VTYRFLPHTADIKVAIDAATFDEVLADGVAVMRLLLTGHSPVVPREQHRIEVEGDDPADMLLRLLQDLLYRSATEGFLPADLQVVQPGPPLLAVLVRGERCDPVVHKPQPEVKAVTRHGFTVAHDDAGWHAEILFDV
jgi:SHS2 domain-containing protein